MNLRLFDRKLRACYLNLEPRVVTRQLAQLESRLSQLGSVRMDPIKSLDDQDFFPCDLLILDAQSVPYDAFSNWLSKIEKKLKQQNKIWVPSLIIANLRFEDLSSVMQEAIAMNWYFDVLDPAHLSSMPIRVANLLRIHDHLHELDRHGRAIQEVQQKCREMEQELVQIKGKG